jgi:hypothetical protein
MYGVRDEWLGRHCTHLFVCNWPSSTGEAGFEKIWFSGTLFRAAISGVNKSWASLPRGQKFFIDILVRTVFTSSSHFSEIASSAPGNLPTAEQTLCGLARRMDGKM